MAVKYEKFIYWLSKGSFEELGKKLLKDGHELFRAKKAVCVPLSKRVDIGYVEPATWDKFDICKR